MRSDIKTDVLLGTLAVLFAMAVGFYAGYRTLHLPLATAKAPVMAEEPLR